MITKIYHSFLFAWNGLQTTWKEEQNFRIEILVGVVVVFCILFFQFSFIETVLSVIAIAVVLTAEIINTAIEDLCNKVEPQHDFVIGKIKDTMAAFVLISVLGAAIVGFMVFYNHFLV
ncbi:MAG: diacylglycerol kinase [Candidatus Zambryskibacteria bacterium]|nr:diacylglycerol kinase [Candidatus Zambryskibacteria bacterium]